MRRLVVALVLALAAVQPAGAVNPDEMLPDPAQEERARDISKGLRCLVCQNESIDESNAELAKDLRVLVRERISAGDSDNQVVQFVVDRYGDYVLLKPPFKASTLVLWLGPAVLLLIAAGAAMAYYRGRRAAEDIPVPLSDEERRRLASLIEDDRS